MASVPPPDYNPASLLPNVAADITTIRGGGFSLDYIGGAGLNTSTIVKFSPGNTSTMITQTPTNKIITLSKEPYELTDPRVKPVRTKPVPGFEEAMLITGDKAKVAQLDTKVITGLSNESIDPICLTDKGVILNSRCAAHSAASAAALGRIVKDDIKKENAKTNYFEEFELSKKPSDFKATTSRKIVDMRYDTDKKQLFLDYEDGDKFYRFYGRNAESLLELLNNKFSAKANAAVGDKPNGKNKTLTVTPTKNAEERINNYGTNVGTLFSNAKEMKGKYPEVNKENKKLYPERTEKHIEYNSLSQNVKNKLDIIPPPPSPESTKKLKAEIIANQTLLITKYDLLISDYDNITLIGSNIKINQKTKESEMLKLKPKIDEISTLKAKIKTMKTELDKDKSLTDKDKSIINLKTQIISSQEDIINSQKEYLETSGTTPALITKNKRILLTLKARIEKPDSSKPKGGKRNSTQKRRGSKIDL